MFRRRSQHLPLPRYTLPSHRNYPRHASLFTNTHSSYRRSCVCAEHDGEVGGCVRLYGYI
jgi:hypothetical protein